MKQEVELRSLEIGVARFLRVGVFVAGTLLLLGWILLFHGSDAPPLGEPMPGPGGLGATDGLGASNTPGLFADFAQYVPLTLVDGFRGALASGRWGALIAYTGLGALIALPFLRVLATGIIFLKRREGIMAALAFTVMLALVASLVLGWEI